MNRPETAQQKYCRLNPEKVREQRRQSSLRYYHRRRAMGLETSQDRYYEKVTKKHMAWYRAQPLEYRKKFTQQGRPRQTLGGTYSPEIRAWNPVYHSINQIKSAVRSGVLAHDSLPAPLRDLVPDPHRVPDFHRFKKKYGETLEQMGQRLGISRERVRQRFARYGTAEPAAIAKLQQQGSSFRVGAKILVRAGVSSMEELASWPNHKILNIQGMSVKKLAQLRKLYAAPAFACEPVVAAAGLPASLGQPLTHINCKDIHESFSGYAAGTKVITLCDRLGIKNLQDITKYSPWQLSNEVAVGKKTIDLITHVLKQAGYDWH
jgi:hypothetical protein